MFWSHNPLLLPPTQHNPSSQTEWIMTHILLFRSEDGLPNECLIKFITSLWSIWLHKNDNVFRNGQGIPMTSQPRFSHFLSFHVQWSIEQHLLGLSFLHPPEDIIISLQVLVWQIQVGKYIVLIVISFWLMAPVILRQTIWGQVGVFIILQTLSHKKPKVGTYGSTISTLHVEPLACIQALYQAQQNQLQNVNLFNSLALILLFKFGKIIFAHIQS